MHLKTAQKDIHLIWPFILFKSESVTKYETCSTQRKCNQELNKTSSWNEPKEYIFLIQLYLDDSLPEFHIFHAKIRAYRNPS